MQQQQRPLGPRKLKPSPSPTPQVDRTRPQRPTITLGLPAHNSPRSRSPTPQLLKIQTNTTNNQGPSDDPDSPQWGYYGGPPLVVNTNTGDRNDDTIRPTPDDVTVPAPTTIAASNGNGIADVKGLLDNLSDAPLTWSDDVLEEISRLGEGAGGAVHKVKDKRTEKIMARKTITTREAPMRQLLRELSIISSTKHNNIVQFYGAYMSPSSSEVKILMDYCAGGSLESVGRKIKERGGFVGEKIAGRLAEGVGLLMTLSIQ
jgi:mitogen-activated protein kinase kinase